MRLVRSSATAALLSTLLSWTSTAHAQASAPTDEAKQHVDRGNVFYNLQDWPAALREFKAAYQVDPKPDTIFMIGQTQRLAGDCTSAIGSYKAYARAPTTSPTQQAAADGLVHKCEAELEEKKQAAEAAQKQQAAAPPPAPVVKPTAPEKPKGPSPWYADGLGGVLFFVGLAAAGAGTGLLVVGNGFMTTAKGATNYRDYDAAVASGKPLQIAGLATLGAGIAFAVGGVVRYVVVAKHTHSDDKLALTITPGLAALSASLQF